MINFENYKLVGYPNEFDEPYAAAQQNKLVLLEQSLINLADVQNKIKMLHQLGFKYALLHDTYGAIHRSKTALFYVLDKDNELEIVNDPKKKATYVGSFIRRTFYTCEVEAHNTTEAIRLIEKGQYKNLAADAVMVNQDIDVYARLK